MKQALLIALFLGVAAIAPVALNGCDQSNEIDKLKKLIDEKEKNIIQIETAKKETEKVANERQALIVQLEGEKTSLANEISKLKEDVNKKTNDLNNTLEQYKSLQDSQKKAEAEHQKTLATIDAEIKAKDEKIAELNNNKAGDQATIAKNKETINRLEEEKNNLHTKAQKAEEQYKLDKAAAQKKAEELTKKVELGKAELTKIGNELKGKEEEIQKKNQEIKNKEEEIHKYRKQITAFEDKEKKTKEWNENLPENIKSNIVTNYSNPTQISQHATVETEFHVWMREKEFERKNSPFKGEITIDRPFRVKYGVELPLDWAQKIETTPGGKLKINGIKAVMLSCEPNGEPNYSDGFEEEGRDKLLLKLEKVAREQADKQGDIFKLYAKKLYEAEMNQLIQSIIDSTKPDGIPQYKHIKVQLD